MKDSATRRTLRDSTMMENASERHARINRLFVQLCDLSAEDCHARLHELSRKEPDIHGELSVLLQHDAHLDSDAPLQLASRLSGIDRRPGSSAVSALWTRKRPFADAAQRMPTIPGYEIEAVLGHGGMGLVYRARSEELGQAVALKLLPAVVGAANPVLSERFRREAESVARLQHPNIVPVFTFGESDAGYYYTMELIDGPELGLLLSQLAALHRHGDTGGDTIPDWMPPSHRPFGAGYFRRVARWIAEVCEALSYAHAMGVIHRDIKPANLMLDQDGVVRITDFGLALTADHETMTQTGAVVGTLRYLSPEQALGRRVPVDHRADLYALGATMYELLTLTRLFDGIENEQLLAAIIQEEPRKPSTLVDDVPRNLETICLKALQKLPEDRYDNAAAMQRDLLAFVGDRPIHARRTGWLRRAKMFMLKRRAIATVSLAAMVVIFTLVVAGLMKESRARRIDELHRTALNLQKDGHWDAASDVYLDILDIDDRDAGALGNLATMLKEQYNHADVKDPALLEDAVDYCDRGLDEAPRNAGLWNLRGVLLKKLGLFDEARRAYEECIALADDASDAHIAAVNNLAEVQALAGDLAEAAESFVVAAEMAGERGVGSCYAWRDLAVLQNAFDDKTAVASIGKATECSNNVDWRTRLVRAWIRLSSMAKPDVEGAISDVKAAGDDTANHPLVERTLALAYLRNGEFQSAVEHATKAIEAGDLPAYPCAILAIANAQLDQLSDASDALVEARRAWASAFKHDKFLITAEGGMFWMDSAVEIKALLNEAANLIDAR